jgi:hypothetical protein
MRVQISLAKSAAIELREVCSSVFCTRIPVSSSGSAGAVSGGNDASLATFQMNFVVECIVNSMNFSYI